MAGPVTVMMVLLSLHPLLSAFCLKLDVVIM